MGAIANKGCPVFNIPQPANLRLVQPFLATGPVHQRFNGGPEIDNRTRPQLLLLVSPFSRARSVCGEFRMGWEWERYVIQTRGVNQAVNVRWVLE